MFETHPPHQTPPSPTDAADASRRWAEPTDTVIFRPARPDECPFLADLFLMASGGVAAYAWQKKAHRHESVLEVGRRLFARADAALSYRNCMVAEHRGRVAGMQCAYRQPSDTAAPLEPDPVMRPFAELRVPGSLYLAAGAVYPEFRGEGLGSEMLWWAEDMAEDGDIDSISVQVFSENVDSLRLLKRRGYAVTDRRRVVPHETLRHAQHVLLLTRPVSAAVDNSKAKSGLAKWTGAFGWRDITHRHLGLGIAEPAGA